MDELVAVVPLRSPGDGKSRLAPALDRDARARLAGAMLADVVTALRGAGLHVVVAAGGPAAAAAAAALQADAVLDTPDVRSLDDAVAHAGRRLAPLPALLVVQADLPGLTADDVRAVIAGVDPVVIAPTDDGGTAALLRRPPTVMGTAFGPDSGRAHQRLAAAAGVTPRVVRRPGLAHDVDVLADLDALDPAAVGAATRRVLAELGDSASDCA